MKITLAINQIWHKSVDTIHTDAFEFCMEHCTAYKDDYDMYRIFTMDAEDVLMLSMVVPKYKKIVFGNE